MATKAGHTLDWEETTASKTKKKVQRNPDYDSSDSERFNETLSDWDIDIKESMATFKSTVCYTAPKKTKKTESRTVRHHHSRVSPTPPCEMW